MGDRELEKLLIVYEQGKQAGRAEAERVMDCPICDKAGTTVAGSKREDGADWRGRIPCEHCGGRSWAK